ncbi:MULTISPECIES: hypothetical protein [unclassified Achromobacter]|uniref:hypothetical protein n=1 Tax=unclassified Achromobacter TaxID=2626865 RepID=UPI001178A37C|nr:MULTISPECIES: hypothetical protein [unclassified Achromobacter]
MTSLDTFASFLRARMLALFSFAAPLPPLPVTGLDRETETTLRSLRKRYRRDRALFQQGLALHRQGLSVAQLNAMFDAVTHYDWDIWAGPCDVSTLEERIERDKILIALLMRECQPALERYPSLMNWIVSDDA